MACKGLGVLGLDGRVSGACSSPGQLTDVVMGCLRVKGAPQSKGGMLGLVGGDPAGSLLQLGAVMEAGPAWLVLELLLEG